MKHEAARPGEPPVLLGKSNCRWWGKVVVVDQLPIKKNGNQWEYIFDPVRSEVKYNGGLSQNNTQPDATFVGHVVVQIGEKIYDPSYEKIYTPVTVNGKKYSALLDFQQQSVFGFFTVTLKSNRFIYDAQKKVRVAVGQAFIEIQKIDSNSTDLQFRFK